MEPRRFLGPRVDGMQRSGSPNTYAPWVGALLLFPVVYSAPGQGLAHSWQVLSRCLLNE